MSTLRLIVMRHAKSDWKTGEPDHERPLNKRGKKDAPHIGRRLMEVGWLPDLVLSSDSARTTETFAGLSGAWPDHVVPVEYLHRFYLGRADDIVNALETLAPSVACAMVLGHNPGWESFASLLSGQAIEMTTANAVLLEKRAADWVEALHSPVLWGVVDILRPRPPRIIPR